MVMENLEKKYGNVIMGIIKYLNGFVHVLFEIFPYPVKMDDGKVIVERFGNSGYPCVYCKHVSCLFLQIKEQFNLSENKRVNTPLQ